MTIECAPCALPRPLLASLVRAVARTNVWRVERSRVQRRMPDDVWEEAGDWVLSFQLSSDEHDGSILHEELLVFQVTAPGTDGRSEVQRGVRVSRIGDEAQVEDLRLPAAG